MAREVGGKRALKTVLMYAMALASFIAIFAFDVSFPLIIVFAALLGYAAYRIAPQLMPSTAAANAFELPDAAVIEHTKPTAARAIKVSSVCLVLWLLPIVVLSLLLGNRHVFVQESVFF